jgi:hypothetical protein
MFRNNLEIFSMKKIDINFYVICSFMAIVLPMLYIHTSTNQTSDSRALVISPISGLEQKHSDFDGTDYNLTSKTAIIKSTGLGSYLLTIKPPLCAPYNSSNVSMFPGPRKKFLKKQTQNSWSIDSRDFGSEMYLVIQSTGSSCTGKDKSAPVLMEIKLSASNQ